MIIGKLLRTAAAVVCGYLVMVALMTVVQDLWFGGVTWDGTPPGSLAVAGFFTCVAGAIGAVVATLVARPRNRTAAAIMSFLAALEATYLISTGELAGPLWFDVLASGSLVVAILVGAELYLRSSRRPVARI